VYVDCVNNFDEQSASEIQLNDLLAYCVSWC